MAFVKTPNTWFANWSEDGTDITVPIASFPQMSVDEADGATGDIRNIVHAIVERLWVKWRDLATLDKPTKMTMNKSTSVNSTTGEITNTYTLTMKTTVTAEEVAEEPTV